MGRSPGPCSCLGSDTLVVFTSDNGGLVREAGGWPVSAADVLAMVGG
jgi:hypothetical protein